MGIYFGNLILFRAKNQPTAYMSDSGGLRWLFDILFSAVGGGLGFLANTFFEKNTLTFDFRENAESGQAEWDKLRKLLSGRSDFESRKFHLAIYGGKVFRQVVNRYEDILKKSGYHIGSFYPFGPSDDGYAEPASSTNLLRRLQLIISLTPKFEAGVASIFLGEPSISGSLYLSDRYTSQSRNVNVKLASTGYYALGLYQPLRGNLPPRIQWRCGVGAGAAHVNFQIQTHAYYSAYPEFSEKSAGHKISKWLASAVIFTEIQYYLDTFLSLGLSADYAWIPSQQAQAFPDAGIPSQNLALGNTSVGLMFVFHF
jgi:hypothetical protein